MEFAISLEKRLYKKLKNCKDRKKRGIIRIDVLSSNSDAMKAFKNYLFPSDIASNFMLHARSDLFVNIIRRSEEIKSY